MACAREQIPGLSMTQRIISRFLSCTNYDLLALAAIASIMVSVRGETSRRQEFNDTPHGATSLNR